MGFTLIIFPDDLPLPVRTELVEAPYFLKKSSPSTSSGRTEGEVVIRTNLSPVDATGRQRH